MFFSDPIGDMYITLILWGIGAVIAIPFALRRSSWLLFGMLVSIFGNVAFLLNIGSLMFSFYHIDWFSYFSLFIWPLINICLMIKYLKKNERNKDR